MPLEWMTANQMGNLMNPGLLDRKDYFSTSFTIGLLLLAVCVAGVSPIHGAWPGTKASPGSGGGTDVTDCPKGDNTVCVVSEDYMEVGNDPFQPTPPQPGLPRINGGTVRIERGPYVSVQINTDELGQNIIGDAANEPSIAVDPTDPTRIAIGWRQFDSVESDFRQAGWAYSRDAGRTWTFPGALEPGVFHSDPVLDAGPDGTLYYYSIPCTLGCGDLFTSTDGGMSWTGPVDVPGNDKPWMTVDRTNGLGRGNLYVAWSHTVSFTRSLDSGATWSTPTLLFDSAFFGTIAVGPDGIVYMVDSHFSVYASRDARDPTVTPSFPQSTTLDLGDPPATGGSRPNPEGLLFQPWVTAYRYPGQTDDHVYVLSSANPPGDDPLDVMFARSINGGRVFCAPCRVNDDLPDNAAWQWFATMSIAPNGRLDAIWNDTRANPSVANLSELYYSFSTDGGQSWSQNVAVSPVFDSHIGWPHLQGKIGDYYDMVSDNTGVNVAYAATFNGEQDVYFLRIDNVDCNDNGVVDTEDIANHTSEDCDANLLPDECQADWDGDGLVEACDPDIDGDGVLNELDQCTYTPVGFTALPDGRLFGDSNGDCHTDLSDYSFYLENSCFLFGPGHPAPRQCRGTLPGNDDEDFDLVDFARFQRNFSGRF